MSELKLNDIITEEFQNEIQDSFSLATGFGVVFADAEGNHIGSRNNFCKFCNKINETKEGTFYCSCTNRKAIAIALKTKKPSIYICHAGLVNIEIPLMHKGECVGAITAGNVRCSEGDIYPREPAPDDINWFDDPELAAYYKEICCVTKKQIEGTATALSNITNYIIQTVAYSQMQEDYARKTEELLKAETRRNQLEEQLKIAQLDALQKQITPHFIFNVINSVSRLMSLEEYNTAKDMLDSFAQMMRYNLSNITSFVTLRHEMDYIENYLAIQKIRFGKRISYQIDCATELESMFIPFFSIQPLVENAVEHGILNKTAGGKLSVSALVHGSHIQICIKDNGIGISKNYLEELRNILQGTTLRKSQKGVGLYNCYHRFLLMFGKNIDFSIGSHVGKGTVITITINKQ